MANSESIDTAQTTSITFSSGVRRMILGFDLHTWETLMVSSLIIAGIFAVLVGVSTWAVVKLTRESVKEANVKIAEALKGVAEANTRTAEANLELAKIKEITFDRVLSADQSEKLKVLRGKLPEIIVTSVNKAEPAAYAGQLVNAFKALQVTVRHALPPASINASGIFLIFPNSINPFEKEFLLKSLMDTGIPFIERTDRSQFSVNEFPADIPIIVVGEKLLAYETPARK